MEYVALYEDRAKADKLCTDQDDYPEVARSKESRTASRFDTLDKAVAWARDAVTRELTVFGVADVREIEQVRGRCEQCICGGRQLVRRHLVSQDGIDETYEAESGCC